MKLQERALLLMYKLGEVAPQTHTIKLYDYKGEYVGDEEVLLLKSTDKEVKLPSNGKRKMIPQMKIKQGFD